MKTIALLLLFSPIVLNAQMKTGDKYIYAGANYFYKNISPTVGLYLFDKKGNINDFQFNGFQHKKSDNGVYSVRSTRFNASYHKIITLFKESDARFKFGIGVGGSLNSRMASLDPISSSVFKTSNRNFGILLSVKPTVHYNFSEKIFARASATVGFIEQGITFSHYDNPAIPANQRKATTIYNTMSLEGNTMFDLTIGFRIN